MNDGRASAEYRDRCAAIREMVGNTPLLEIALRYRGRPRRLFAKAEFLNLTGSIKDRMALHIMDRACAGGQLRPGDTIVEATSGNTGIAFAAIGRALGHPVIIYMPDWMSQERVQLIRSFGAVITPVSKQEGGFLGSIGLTDFPRGNHDQLIASIKNRLWPLGDATVFIPGHGPESSFGRERRTNPFVADH